MNGASVERKEVIGLHRITEKRLRELCKKDKLYQTPELNDVLYLHYQGFQYIECLEKYTELKCLWLECNAISEIEGLQNQTKLKCLFLQNNLIKRIENLQPCRELDTLNLASNHIRKIENCGVDVLPVLNTLNLSSNYLRDSESLRALEECTTLSVLDLSNNRIDDILVVKVFAKMTSLRVLVLQGNPVVSKIPQYRKTITLECKELTYLDSRPVFPKDRACAEAWKRGGYAEERKEQARWNRRERKKIRDSVNATIRMRNRHLPQEKQMDLCTSSDSETEEKRRKEDEEYRKNMTDPRLLEAEDDEDQNLLDIWDEVAEPTPPQILHVDNFKERDEEKLTTVNNSPSEKLEISEQKKNSSNLLHLVKNETENTDDIPELVNVTEIEATTKRRPLIEEIKIQVSSEIAKEGTFEVQNRKVHAPELIEKRLFIEVVDSKDRSEEIKNERKAEFLEVDNKNLFLQKVTFETPNPDEYTKEKPSKEVSVSKEKFSLIEEINENKENKDRPWEMDSSEQENENLVSQTKSINGNEEDQTQNNFLELDDNHLLLKTMKSGNNKEKPKKVNECPLIEEIGSSNISKSQKRTKSSDSSEDDDSSSITSISFESSTAELSQKESDDEEEATQASENPVCTTSSIIASESASTIMEKISTIDDDVSSESEDEVAKQEYNETANAICDVVMSHLDESELPSPERPTYNIQSDLLSTNVENYEPEWDIQNILDSLPDDNIEMRNRRLEDLDEPEEVIVKTIEEIAYDMKCEDVNRQMVKDLEELTQSMDSYIEGVRQQEQQAQELCSENQALTRLEDSLEYKTDESQTTTSCSEDHDFEEIKTGDGAPATAFIEIECNIDKNDSSIQNQLSQDNTSGHHKKVVMIEDVLSKCDVEKGPQLDSFKILPDSKDELKSEDVTLGSELVAAGVNYETKEPQLDLSTYSKNPAIETYEKESIELKELLMKLEKQNEKLTLVKRVCKELMDDKSGDEYNDAEDTLQENEHMVKYVIKDLVTEVLDREAEIQQQAVKNYEITDLESDEEYSYSDPVEPEETPVKTIGSVLCDFNNMIRKLGQKNQDDRLRKETVAKRIPSTEGEKAQSLQTLIETPGLLDHHKDAYDELNERVMEVKERQSEALKRLVDRVYAQRYKYEDSLEVMDGRLVVVKKESGEIEEISARKSPYGAAYSDEETEGDDNKTPNEDEDVVASCSKNVNYRQTWDFGMGVKDAPHTWMPSYRPTMRKSAEKLVLEALQRNNVNAAEQSGDENDNENEENLNSISSIFGNIDEDFFDKLDFQKIAAEGANDGNFVECARSYEELRQYMRPTEKPAEECKLTAEEQEIIDKLQSVDIESKAKDSVETEIPQEDEMMKNLVQRTKEAKERLEEMEREEKLLEEKKLRGEDGKRIDIYRCSEYSGATDTIFELKPTGSQQTKMLQKLKTNDVNEDAAETAAGDTRDFGDFTEPLEGTFDKLSEEEESNFEEVRAAYALQLLKWREAMKRKRDVIDCSEVGVQCIPSDILAITFEDGSGDAKITSIIESENINDSETAMTKSVEGCSNEENA